MRRSLAIVLSALAFATQVHASPCTQLPREDFNRRAVRSAEPLFWLRDTNGDGVLQPAELVQTWGAEELAPGRFVADRAFTPAFDAACARLLAAPADSALLAPAERRRRAAIEAELAQARPTVLAYAPATPRERVLVEAIERAARGIERLYALQTGVAGLQDAIPTDDSASRAVFFRNQGPLCRAPRTQDDPDCYALPARRPPLSGLYPATLQSDPEFCAALAARADSATLLDWFTVVRAAPRGGAAGHAAGNDLVAVPFHVAWPDEMRAVSRELRSAASALAGEPAEAAFVRYLQAAADAFENGDWYAADAAWAAMSATNSAWFLRVGPDEVLEDPCGRKGLFHLAFARINRESLAWQQRLEPVKDAMEREFAALTGAPYTARRVGFQLPDFIDVVLNAGDSRQPLGAVIGQSLPNSGPVAASGGRTVVMTNLDADPDSLAAFREASAALFCPATLGRMDLGPRRDTISTVLHEAAHNLGPVHGYAVSGRTAPEIFGGPLASLLEEFKAQAAALYFPAWLAARGLLTEEASTQSQLSNISWSMAQLAKGLQEPDGQPRPYAQLSSMQLDMLYRDGVLAWHAGQRAANGRDTGCFEVDLGRWQPAVTALTREVLGVMGRGDRAAALKLRDAGIAEDTPWAALRHVIAERWLRQPVPYLMYAPLGS